MNEEKKSSLVLIFLPRFEDLLVTDSDPMRKWLAQEAEKRKVPLIDLVEAFRKIGRDEVRPYFSGHYSEEGNRVVARMIYDRLLKANLVPQPAQ